MPRLRHWLLILALSGASAAVLAQPGPGMGPASGPGYRMGPGMGPGMGQGPGPGASAPGMGPRAGAGPMGRWGADHTPGWTLMSPAERAEHQKRMGEMKTYEDCQALHAKHREQMEARAKERGQTLRAPRRDACSGFKR